MNSRPPPPQGGRSILTRFSGRNLRWHIVFTTVVTGLWSILSAIGFYRNIGPYKDNDAPTLATISIIIGSVYMGVFAIGAFGFFAALSQKLKLIRIFAYLSALAVIMVSGINLARIVIHFTMRDAILQACTNDATGRIYVYGGWWGPINSDILSPLEAKQFCTHYYDRDSWSLVIGFLCLTVVGVFFSILAFAYLRQTLDPLSPANVIRDPQPSGFSPAYHPPYGAYNAGYGYNNFPPPQGPPPAAYPAPPHDDDGKPPGYSGHGWQEGVDMQKTRDFDEENAPRTGDLRH